MLSTVTIVKLSQQTKLLKKSLKQFEEQLQSMKNVASNTASELTHSMQINSQRNTFAGTKKEEHYIEMYNTLTDLELLFKEKKPNVELIQKKWSFSNRLLQSSLLFMSDEMREKVNECMNLFSQFVYQIEKDGKYFFPEGDMIRLSDLEIARNEVKKQFQKETQLA